MESKTGTDKTSETSRKNLWKVPTTVVFGYQQYPIVFRKKKKGKTKYWSPMGVPFLKRDLGLAPPDQNSSKLKTIHYTRYDLQHKRLLSTQDLF